MNYFKLKFSLMFLGIVFLFLCSCKKKEGSIVELGSQSKFTLLDAHRLENSDWKGLFSITDAQMVTQTYEAGMDWHRGAVFVGTQAFKDVSQLSPAVVNGISVKISDMRDGTPPNQKEFSNLDAQGESLFGQNADINAFGMSGKMYIPKKMRLLTPKPDNVSINSFLGTPAKRSEGVRLKWTADLKNQRGVILIVEHRTPQGTPIRALRILDDTGSFTIDADLLNDVPKDGYFEVTLARGNYHLSDSKEDLIMCLTSVTSGYKMLD